MIKVYYGCDYLGDHRALTVNIIDVDFKTFSTLESALKFAIECTECLNLRELLKKQGISEAFLDQNLHKEDLLLNFDNFVRYKDNNKY
jgi:hypothetical protein